MARKVFISVLGFSNYNECIYSKEVYKSNPVRFIQEATLGYLLQESEWKDNDSAYILLTEEAETANWIDNGQKNRTTGESIPCEGLCTRLCKMNLPFAVQTISHLPHGNNEKEIWDIFERTFENLQEGDELYFDLTHGFRYLPMLVMVLINYSKFLKNTTVKSITYGNYESRNKENVAPIIDLLPLSALQDWTYAAGQFIDAGNVQRLAQLSKDKIRPIMITSAGKDENAKNLTGFINYLSAVVDEIQTCRGINIIQATNLLKLHNLTSQLNDTFIKPLNPIFAKIENQFDGYEENNASNCFRAVRWCMDNGLYQQAITILLEGILTIICIDCNVIVTDRDERTLVSSVINLYLQKQLNNWNFSSDYTEEQNIKISTYLNSAKLQTFAKIYKACSDLRNDMNHAGMRDGSMNAANIKKGILKMVNRSMELLNETPKDEVTSLKTNDKLMINLSNHPYDTWSENQKAAAAVYGNVVDIQFPSVNESDDMDYINALADQYFLQIQEMIVGKDVTIHIMGELTFTFALLKRLQERGIRCVASTSKRIVKEEVPGRKEEVIFEFERFREYC